MLLREHLDDLYKSGLTDDTIPKMNVSSVGPDELDSRFKMAGVQSAIRFEYLRLNGQSPFYRLKFIPPLTKDNGHVQKYWQPGETGCRLYVPDLVVDIFRDKDKPLLVTEGEKKAWAGVQAGFPTVAIGGIYNFNDKETDWLIPELDEALKPGRVITYVPDSDVWIDPRKLEAVFRLGMKIETAHGQILSRQAARGSGRQDDGIG